MTIQLTGKQYDVVKKILKQCVPEADCYIFGSRAKGTAKQYSDLDIMIKMEAVIALGIMSSLREAFSDSNLPFTVDIVDWLRISEEFQQHISQTSVKVIH